MYDRIVIALALVLFLTWPSFAQAPEQEAPLAEPSLSAEPKTAPRPKPRRKNKKLKRKAKVPAPVQTPAPEPVPPEAPKAPAPAPKAEERAPTVPLAPIVPANP